jgi:hypothetical protein
MLGRSMANVMDEYVFVLGSERSTSMRQVIEKTPPPRGLTIGRLGADLIGTRSDYGPFRDRNVPFFFFSTGQHPDYHAPSDLPERIDYGKLQSISTYIGEVTKLLANEDIAPSWNEKPLPPDLEEIRTVAVLVNRVLRRQDLYPLPEKKREMVQGVQKRLSTILEKGTVAAEDRSWLMWNARLLLMTVF